MKLVEGGVQISKARLTEAGIKVVETDGRSTKYIQTMENGDVYQTEVVLPDPKASADAKVALAPKVTKTLISRGGGGSNVPIDPNKE